MPLLSDICEMYAAKTDARASCFVCADNVLAALVVLGIVNSGDRAVVFCDGEEDSLRLVADATGVQIGFSSSPDPDCMKSLSGETAYGNLFWLVCAIGGEGLRVAPLRALAREAQAAGAFLVVDTTLVSSYCAHPLAMGCAFTCETSEVAQDGPAPQAITAVSVTRSRRKRKRVDPLAEDAFALFEQRTSAPAPSDADSRAFKASLDSQALRMQMRFDRARAIAEYFAANEYVTDVCYPGLVTHPDHAVATGVLMHGFGPALEFSLSAQMSASSFLDDLPPRFTERSYDGASTHLLASGGAGTRRVRLYAGTDNPFEAIHAIDKALRKAASHF